MLTPTSIVIDMIYISNLIRNNNCADIQHECNQLTAFNGSFYPIVDYKWISDESFGYINETHFTEYDEDYLKCNFGGYIGNVDKMLLKFIFELRVSFKNKTDFPIAVFDYISTKMDNDIKQELQLCSRIKKFKFIPNSDRIYLKMNVVDINKPNGVSRLRIKFRDFGFNVYPKDFGFNVTN